MYRSFIIAFINYTHTCTALHLHVCTGTCSALMWFDFVYSTYMYVHDIVITPCSVYMYFSLQKGETALMKTSSVEFAKLLLDWGAKINHMDWVSEVLGMFPYIVGVACSNWMSKTVSLMLSKADTHSLPVAICECFALLLNWFSIQNTQLLIYMYMYNVDLKKQNNFNYQIKSIATGYSIGVQHIFRFCFNFS